MTIDPNITIPPVVPPVVPAAVPTFKEQMAAFGPEIANNPNISKHEDLASLVKSHVHVQAFVGSDKVALPKKDDIQDVSRFFHDLGRPGEATGYTPIPVADGEEIGWDDAFSARVNQLTFDSGVTQDQHAVLVPKFIELLREESKSIFAAGETHANETIAGLKAKHGATYDAKMEAGNRAIQDLFGAGWAEFREKQFLDGTRVGNSPEMLDALIKFGELHSVDDPLAPGVGQRVPQGMDVATAKSQIKQKEADPAFRQKWLNKDHPQHDEALQELHTLYAYANPE